MRTGTKSLFHVFSYIFGWKSGHFTGGDGLRKIEKYNFLVDTYTTKEYKLIDVTFPKSKFILTIRDIDTWLVSCENMNKFYNNRTYPGFAKEIFKQFGTSVFDKTVYRQVYEEHIEKVQNYFKDRSADLLVLDICSGKSTIQQIMNFLSISEIPIPHKNKLVIK